MSIYQRGITLENRDFAIFMEIDFNTEDFALIREKIKEFQARIPSLRTRFGNAGLGAVIAFSANAWRQLYKYSRSASALKDFREIGYGMAQATQHDMFIHILSHRQDVNYTLAKMAVEIFGGIVNVEEEIHGFRWLEARDLSGFIDGTENPKDEDRKKTAIVEEGIDTGGSFVLAQRWVHHLKQLNHFDLTAQETIFGRTKNDDIELDDKQKLAASHTSRVVIEERGEELKIVRQSLPYGKASGEHGLYFLAYSAEISRLEKMLKMMFGETDGEFDLMLSFTHAVTGGYYYAPSLEQLESL